METENTTTEKASGTESFQKALQVAGSLCMLIGAFVLMVQGLGHISSTDRFFILTAILTATAAGGLFLGLKKQETSAARWLLGIFLVLSPVFWMQLAAVIFAATELPFGNIPGIFQMQVPSLMATVAAGLLGLLVTAPLGMLSAKVFVPGASYRFGFAVFLLGLAACIPYRTGNIAEALIMLAPVAALLYERYTLSRIAFARTSETLIARMVIQSFPIILTCRAAFYGYTPAIGFSVFTSLSCLYVFALGDGNKRATSIVADCSMAIALYFATTYLDSTFDRHFMEFLYCVIPGAYFVAKGVCLQSEKSVQEVLGYALFSLGSILISQASYSPYVLVGLALSVSIFAAGFARRSHLTLWLSAIAVYINVSHFAKDLWEYIQGYGWAALMVAGLLMVFGAPYIKTIEKSVRSFWTKGSKE